MRRQRNSQVSKKVSLGQRITTPTLGNRSQWRKNLFLGDQKCDKKKTVEESRLKLPTAVNCRGTGRKAERWVYLGREKGENCGWETFPDNGSPHSDPLPISTPLQLPSSFPFFLGSVKSLDNSKNLSLRFSTVPPGKWLFTDR
ncbi:Hypothetical protein NTJ_00779 [Nesidiocoris tenuis]|uniref:Uncharacterized protein n=1 Tax=Nesidiocoris tenuis TaxID=355587 RepID=A0ABN7A6U7_9HEMI|nr:Hypothetical protein NTJ_00779 [Nesidiocoris tenuis]